MMTGLDTNVLVRYLAQDDDAQLSLVLKLLMKKAAVFFVPDLVLVETDWVLRSLYQWTREEACDVFSRLLTVHNLVFEDEGRLRGALRAVRKGADLSDELIVAICQKKSCQHFVTFDKGVLKNHPRFAAEPKRAECRGRREGFRVRREWLNPAQLPDMDECLAALGQISRS